MSKKQFLFLTILTIVVTVTISICMGFLLPKETIIEETMHVILSLCMGIWAGIIMSIIAIVFKSTRKDN